MLIIPNSVTSNIANKFKLIYVKNHSVERILQTTQMNPINYTARELAAAQCIVIRPVCGCVGLLPRSVCVCVGLLPRSVCGCVGLLPRSVSVCVCGGGLLPP